MVKRSESNLGEKQSMASYPTIICKFVAEEFICINKSYQHAPESPTLSNNRSAVTLLTWKNEKIKSKVVCGKNILDT